MANLFERLKEGRPSIDEPAPLATPLPVRRLLNWLQHTWSQPTVCTRDLYRHGPRPVRDDREIALEAAKILEKRGWLIPLDAHRRDRKRWQITIGPA
jgi:hypothetical protein